MTQQQNDKNCLSTFVQLVKKIEVQIYVCYLNCFCYKITDKYLHCKILLKSKDK